METEKNYTEALNMIITVSNLYSDMVFACCQSVGTDNLWAWASSQDLKGLKQVHPVSECASKGARLADLVCLQICTRMAVK